MAKNWRKLTKEDRIMLNLALLARKKRKELKKDIEPKKENTAWRKFDKKTYFEENEPWDFF